MSGMAILFGLSVAILSHCSTAVNGKQWCHDRTDNSLPVEAGGQFLDGVQQPVERLAVQIGNVDTPVPE
jgi:hypothetical protein